MREPQPAQALPKPPCSLSMCAHGDQKRTSGVSPALSTDSFEAGTLLDSGGPAILPRLETTKPKWRSYLQLLGSWGDGHSYRHSAWYMHA